MTDLDELKRLAARAKSRGEVWYASIDLPHFLEHYDYDFIAAASPVVVMEMIAEIEDLRRQLDTMGRY